jgi:hypothetical protein
MAVTLAMSDVTLHPGQYRITLKGGDAAFDAERMIAFDEPTTIQFTVDRGGSPPGAPPGPTATIENLGTGEVVVVSAPHPGVLWTYIPPLHDHLWRPEADVS